MLTKKFDDALYVSPIEGFSELADTYDARCATSPVIAIETGAVHAALPADLRPTHRVADFGCGTGRHAIAMAQRGIQGVVGVDLAPPMIAVAARKARRLELPIHWHVGDLSAALPLPDNSVDVGICALAMTFLPDLHAAFHGIARTLAPGGFLIVSDYHPCGLFAALTDSRARLANDHAPYYRFTSAAGEECRIAQRTHTVADYFAVAQDTGLTLDLVLEPLVDREFASVHGVALRDRIGCPLAMVLRFRKPAA